MCYDLDFSNHYQVVRPIVLRLYRLYHIKLWEISDWEQEGMLTLHRLLIKSPNLAEDTERLRVYFKTTFSNLINDELRRQESQKRQFNKLAYEDITEVAHLVPSQGMLLDDYVVFQDSLTTAKTRLKPAELLQLEELASLRAFKGRSKLVRKLQGLMAG